MHAPWLLATTTLTTTTTTTTVIAACAATLCGVNSWDIRCSAATATASPVTIAGTITITITTTTTTLCLAASTSVTTSASPHRQLRVITTGATDATATGSCRQRWWHQPSRVAWCGVRRAVHV